MTGRLGEAPALPPEEEPPPRGRRGRPGEVREAPKAEEKGELGAPDYAARERPAGCGAEVQGLDGSAKIMTQGGFTAP